MVTCKACNRTDVHTPFCLEPDAWVCLDCWRAILAANGDRCLECDADMGGRTWCLACEVPPALTLFHPDPRRTHVGAKA